MIHRIGSMKWENFLLHYNMSRKDIYAILELMKSFLENSVNINHHQKATIEINIYYI